MAITRAAAGSAHHHPRRETTASDTSVIAASAAAASVSTPSPRSAELDSAAATISFRRARNGRTSSDAIARMIPRTDFVRVGGPSKRANGLEADVERDHSHRGFDEALCATLEVLRAVRIAALAPEPPDEHSRGGRVQKRVERETGQRETARHQPDDQGADSDCPVPCDCEVRKSKRGDDVRAAIDLHAAAPRSESTGHLTGRETGADQTSRRARRESSRPSSLYAMRLAFNRP